MNKKPELIDDINVVDKEYSLTATKNLYLIYF